jgi:hypothetical protein
MSLGVVAGVGGGEAGHVMLQCRGLQADQKPKPHRHRPLQVPNTHHDRMACCGVGRGGGGWCDVWSNV